MKGRHEPPRRRDRAYAFRGAGATCLQLCQDGIPSGCGPLGPFVRTSQPGPSGQHVGRRGDHRVIYRIDDHRRRVDVVAIEHRSDIYRPRQP
jgi:hypothetical protein